MDIEVISTGDEVITGLITDTNAAWLCQRLLDLGLQPRLRHTVSDDTADIAALISARAEAADIIFINGGLGPTSDDNTARAAAHAAGVDLVRHDEWVTRLEAWHRERGRPMPPSNLKQADLPEGAELIDNARGTACGFRLRIGRAWCFFTPGVPSEFKAMFEASIEPWLREHCLDGPRREVRRLFLHGISESALQQLMGKFELPATVTLGYRAAYPLLELKLIGSGAAPALLDELTAQLENELKAYHIMSGSFEPAKAIGELCGLRPFVVYDSLTAGRLGMMLIKGARVHRYVAADRPYDKEHDEHLLDTGDETYLTLIVGRGEDGAAKMRFEDPESGMFQECSYTLNLTLKDRAAETYALVTLAMVLRTLQKRMPLRPDEAQITFLNRRLAD